VSAQQLAVQAACSVEKRTNDSGLFSIVICELFVIWCLLLGIFTMLNLQSAIINQGIHHGTI